MRHYKAATATEDAFSILALDDDPIMTSTIQAYFQRAGYRVDTENDPVHAVERVREGRYDILLLDFLMSPICGDQVVEEVRAFNRDIFIIMLTGHKTMAPPIRTIRALDIQGYYEKNDRFDQLELLVESCVKSIRQMRTIRSYQDGLTAMMDALPGIYHLQSLDRLADSILQAITRLLGCGSGVLVLDPARGGAAPAGPGGQSYLSWAVGPRAQVPEAEQIRQIFDCLDPQAPALEPRRVTVPLASGTQPAMGFLRLQTRSALTYEQIQLTEVFARQAAAALSNAFLHKLVQEKSGELDQAYGRMRANYAEIIAAVREMVDAKDIYTRNHSDRVSFYAVELAGALGKDESYRARLKVAGLFHDIGKMGIPDGILLKADFLTPEEFAVIKTHPARGEKLLSGITYFRDLLPAVRGHHERWNGSGYPDGLRGADIPEQARIIAVADAFDAMTSDRRYRKSLSIGHAVEELRNGRGSQFDPACVDAFLKLLETPDFLSRAAGADEPIEALGSRRKGGLPT